MTAVNPGRAGPTSQLSNGGGATSSVVSTIFWICGTVGSFLFCLVLGAGQIAWNSWDANQYPDGDGQAGAAIGFVVWVGGAAIAFVWGGADGWRCRSLVVVIVRWALAGFGSNVGEIIYDRVTNYVDPWSDIAARGMTLSVLCAIGAGVGWLAGGYLPADPGRPRLRMLPWSKTKISRLP